MLMFVFSITNYKRGERVEEEKKKSRVNEDVLCLISITSAVISFVCMIATYNNVFN